MAQKRHRATGEEPASRHMRVTIPTAEPRGARVPSTSLGRALRPRGLIDFLRCDGAPLPVSTLLPPVCPRLERRPSGRSSLPSDRRPISRLSFWDDVAGVALEATRAKRGSSTTLRSRREAELRLGCLRLQPATIPYAPAGE